MREIVNLTDENSQTYKSEMVKRFTWSEDPEGTRGLLFVEYTSEQDYVYYDVPERVYESLAKLSEQFMPQVMENADESRETDLPTTVGEYLNEFIVPVYDKEDVYYNRIDDVLDRRRD